MCIVDLSDEEGNAQLEEQEALELQKQMAEQLDEDDFGLENFRVRFHLCTVCHHLIQLMATLFTFFFATDIYHDTQL